MVWYTGLCYTVVWCTIIQLAMLDHAGPFHAICTVLYIDMVCCNAIVYYILVWYGMVFYAPVFSDV